MLFILPVMIVGVYFYFLFNFHSNQFSAFVLGQGWDICFFLQIVYFVFDKVITIHIIHILLVLFLNYVLQGYQSFSSHDFHIKHLLFLIKLFQN